MKTSLRSRDLALTLVLSAALAACSGSKGRAPAPQAPAGKAGKQAALAAADAARYQPELKTYSDGLVAVSGRGYSASFEAAGATFRLPLPGDAAIGEDADTISLALRSIEYEGRQVFARPEGVLPAVRAETGAVEYRFAEAGVVERYQAVAEGIEQGFVIAKPAALREEKSEDSGTGTGTGTGTSTREDTVHDLLIRCALATRMETKTRRGDFGWEPINLHGRHGEALLGNVTVRDARGETTRSPLRLEEGAYSILVSGDWLAGAEWPIDVDPMLASATHLSGASNLPDRHPEVAYNSDADEYLVVWDREFAAAGGASERDIRAQRVDAKGAPIGSFIQLDNVTPNDATWPAVAWSQVNQQYLVVWQEQRPAAAGSTTQYWEVKARGLDATGKLIGSAPFVVGTSTLNNRFPDVGADLFGTEWLVVWEREFATNNWDIRGQRVSATGKVGNLIEVYTGPYKQLRPCVNPVALSRVWVVAWQSEVSVGGQTDIRARVINTDGTVPYPDFPVHQPTASTATETNSERSPDVDGFGTLFLVAYEREFKPGDNDVYASVVDTSTRTPTQFPVTVQADPHETINVSVAFFLGTTLNINKLEYLIMWSDKRNAVSPSTGNWDVYGERIDILGNLLENDFPLSTHVSEQGSPRASARNKSATASYLVVYDSLQSGIAQVYSQKAGELTPAPSIGTSSLVAGAVGQPYTDYITGYDGASPYSWSIVGGSGTTPPGVALDASVHDLNTTLDGTPTTAGSYTFRVRLTDALGRQAEQGYTIVVTDGPQITTTSLSPSSGTVAASYSATISAQNGTSPYDWSVIAGSLPPGLSLGSATGLSTTLSGTPTYAGFYNFTVQLEDANGFTATQDYDLSIDPPVGPVIATTTLPSGDVNKVYTATIQAQQSVSNPTYTWSLASGSAGLPAGLSLTSSGGLTATISGTPTQTGTVTITVQVSDGSNSVDTQDLVLRIVPGAPPSITTKPPLPIASLNKLYDATNPFVRIDASQAVNSPQYTWSVVQASGLPAGLQFSNNVPSTPSIDITGIPTQAGTFKITIQVTDGFGQAAQADFDIVVSAGPVFTTTTLKPAYLGQVYSAQVTWSGGAGNSTLGLAAGSAVLPAGLSLTPPTAAAPATATLGGVPTVAAGSYSFTLEAKDAAGNATTQAYTLQVVDMPVITQNFSLPTADFNQLNYSATLTVAGGVAPYAWSPTPVAGALPGGLTIDASNGAITGTVSTLPSTYHFTVRVTDANGMADEESFFIDVQGGPRFLLAKASTTPGVVPPVALPSALAGVAYSADVSATAGIAPLSYSLAGGNAPPGLAVDSGSGKLGGTPASAGSFSFVVQVTDSRTVANGGPQNAAQTFELTVLSPPKAASRRKGPLGCSISSFDQGTGQGGDPLSGAWTLLLVAFVLVLPRTSAGRFRS